MVDEVYMKKWLETDKELEPYYDDFDFIDVGIQTIDPRKIIALSRKYVTIFNDNSMQKLKAKVLEHGWNDPFPQSLHLVKLPSDVFVVESGGNHRAILANEMGLTEIMANITVIRRR